MPANLPKDHVPLRQEQFLGLYSRGVSDTTPDNYFLDCLNTKYSEGEVSTRDGSTLVFSKSNIVRAFKYKRLGETARYILLDNAGNLYDSLYPNNPIYSDATFTDFSMVNYNNRAYITPHDRVRGIPGKYLLVYQGGGPGTCRQAAGDGPTGFTLAVANSATIGSVEAGIHIIAVCYISDTGYITSPGPAIFAQLNASGGYKCDVSNIPVGPSWVSQRVLVATKSIPTTLFNGDQLGYAFYFVPNGVINDNSTTTATIDFYDASLLESADYLLDNLNAIPAGLGLTVYNGRLLTWAANGEEHTVRGSNPLDPETFDAADGLFTVDPSDSQSGVRNCVEYRKNLIIAKSNRLKATSDNGDTLSTWSIDDLDGSAGTECFGFAKILDLKGTQNDRLFFADPSGLLDFNGVVKRPELSYNIEDIWKRINKSYFNLVQVVDDPVNHRLFVSVPLDNATGISHILYADYAKAWAIDYGTTVLDEKKIKWSKWSFPTAPVSIIGDTDASNMKSVFEVVRSDGVYDIKEGLISDNNVAIESYIQTSLKTSAKGWINHFGGVKLRIKGIGSLQITATGEDDSNSKSFPSISLQVSPGYEPDRLLNFENEKMSLKFRLVNINEKFTISRIDVYAKPKWLRRPS